MPRSYTLATPGRTSGNPVLRWIGIFPQPKCFHLLGLCPDSLQNRHESNLPKNLAPGDDETSGAPFRPGK